MGRFANEDQVFSLLPFDSKRPDEVRVDGQGGVTRSTWDYLVRSVETEILVRLTTSGVATKYYTHDLVKDAANLLVAGQVMRKSKAFQELVNSYFAEANVKLRLFFDDVAGYSETASGGEVVNADVILLTDDDLADSSIGLSIFGKIKMI